MVNQWLVSGSSCVQLLPFSSVSGGLVSVVGNTLGTAHHADSVSGAVPDKDVILNLLQEMVMDPELMDIVAPGLIYDMEVAS